jgi:hypothetical protein
VIEKNIQKNKIYFLHKREGARCIGNSHYSDCFGDPYLFLGEHGDKLLVTKIVQNNDSKDPDFMKIRLKDFKNFHFYSDNKMAFNKKTYINPALIKKFKKSELLTENLEKETLEATFNQQKFFKIFDKRIKILETKLINDNKL